MGRKLDRIGEAGAWLLIAGFVLVGAGFVGLMGAVAFDALGLHAWGWQVIGAVLANGIAYVVLKGFGVLFKTEAEEKAALSTAEEWAKRKGAFDTRSDKARATKPRKLAR